MTTSSNFDKLMIRCPSLGGEVTFAYCRQEQGALPCGQTIVCWQARFPVDEYLRRVMSADDWSRCFARLPKDKLSQILEITEEVKKRED